MNTKLEPAEWKQVFELLDAALDQPETGRGAWLAALAVSHPTLHPALCALLERHSRGETGDFLRALPQFTRVDEPGAISGAMAPGAMVGPYRLLREIGTGGMGSVWLAERADGAFKRQVALKLPNTWSGRLAEQMIHERDILAALEHPNIARLYDAGVDAAGRPFMAMEYVEGQPIDRYAHEHALPVEACLRLIREVATAVVHAHSKLIVHRDLKPGNVLVTADGSVRLLDFGIARLLEGDESAEARRSRTVVRALTPDYASPEQVRGETIGTATDVYSLAVVAYEILTGRRPYRLEHGGAAQIEAAIANEDPPLASQAAHDPQRARALRGDVDAILNRALKKDPRERYATMDAFAQDIERHLRGDPVTARPDSRTYRLGRFIARHRAGTAATIAVLLAIVVGASVALWQARVARAEARRATDINTFILSLFKSAGPTGGGGSDLRVTALLEHSLPRIEHELRGQPQRQIELYGSVAQSLRELNAYREAVAAFDKALDVAARNDLSGEDAAIEARIGKADALVALDDLAGAERLIDGTERELRGRAPGRLLAHSWMVRSYLQLNQREPEKAIASAMAGAKLFRKLDGEHSISYLEALLELARAQYHGDRCADAMPSIDFAMRQLPVTLGTTTHPDVMSMRGVRARCLKDLRRYEESRAEFERNDAPVRATYGATSKDYAIELLEHGDVERLLGNSAAAAALAQNAVAILTANDVHGYSVVGGKASLTLSLVQGRYLERADAAIRDYHAVALETFGADDREVMVSNVYAALNRGLGGDLAAGISQLEALIVAMPPKGESYRARAQSLLAWLQLLKGEASSAAATLETCLPALEARGAPDEVWLAIARARYGVAQLDLGHTEAAKTALERALDEHVKLVANPTPDRADIWVGLAREELAAGRRTRARQLAAAADDFWTQHDARSRWAGEAAYWAGRAAQEDGDAVLARPAFLRAARLLSSSRFNGDAALAADARARAGSPGLR